MPKDVTNTTKFGQIEGEISLVLIETRAPKVYSTTLASNVDRKMKTPRVRRLSGPIIHESITPYRQPAADPNMTIEMI
jgi:hypothetical protein